MAIYFMAENSWVLTKSVWEELSKRKCNQEQDLEITELPSKKKGHFLLLGELLDGQVQSYIKELCSKGTIVSIIDSQWRNLPGPMPSQYKYTGQSIKAETIRSM